MDKTSGSLCRKLSLSIHLSLSDQYISFSFSPSLLLSYSLSFYLLTLSLSCFFYNYLWYNLFLLIKSNAFNRSKELLDEGSYRRPAACEGTESCTTLSCSYLDKRKDSAAAIDFLSIHMIDWLGDHLFDHSDFTTIGSMDGFNISFGCNLKVLIFV